jgi:gibberellin A4 carboxyl methyltransferase
LPEDKTPIAEPVAHATTTGMTGGGFYDANSAPQWKAIEAVLPWLDEAVANLPLSGMGSVTLADFGCSEGRNSIAVMSRALETLLPLTSRPIQTIHSDLPTNDFSKLFLNLLPEGRPVYQSDRVYSSAVGGSMFDQLLPPASVHLATTFNAIGFLSGRPVDKLPGYILPNGPSTLNDNGYVSEDDKQTFSELAKGDVARFLRARAKEMVPGGKLLVQVFGSTDTARTCDGIYDLLNDAVLGFVESGDITRDTYEAYYQPVYMRHLDELTAAVTDDAYGASGLFSVDHSKACEVAVPFNQQYRNDGDISLYAGNYVNFFRAFTEAVLQNALPGQPDRANLVSRIYTHAEELLARSPERYPFRYAAVAMLLTRKG